MRALITLLLSACFVLGCATIIHGTEQSVGIASSPAEAKVFIDGIPRGEAPVTAELDRGRTHSVKLKLEGYEPYSTTITNEVSGWVWGNIIFGGLIGLAVDAISGGIYKLEPKELTASLEEMPEQQRREVRRSELFLAVVLQPRDRWRKIGQLEPLD